MIESEHNVYSSVHSTSRRSLVGATLGVIAGSLLSNSARAQATFPTRPIRLVVPFAAGGPADMMTRALANALATQTGYQWVVENKPGAGGNIAASHVASSPADGHTLLVAGQAILAINKPLFGKLTYDPDRDFAWVGMMGSQPNVLIVNTEAVPVSNIQGFIDYSRANPGKVAYGSNGVGSLAHLKTEVMAQIAGLKFIHVPYQGAAPQRTDLLSGRIGFSQIGASAAIPLLQGDKIRALAVSTGKRSPALPNVPTLIEAGFADLDVPVWFAAVAHAATPAPVLSTLRQAISNATATGAYGAEMAKQHGTADAISVDAAERMLARERRIWADAVRITGASAS
ncbi:MAG: tripartite tricarboxylate transporter substrate binding protein [Betaproteobacteria bacterium]|nr:tripartite tricarboxylate transporter substrate binding protein [Betaproteobacteria bacterium]